MTILPDPRDVKLEKFGLADWAWPLLGLAGGLVLVVVVHGICFVKADS